ncbi:MAG: hypothetical protein QM680_02335 [Luteolibacter sp.]
MKTSLLYHALLFAPLFVPWTAIGQTVDTSGLFTPAFSVSPRGATSGIVTAQISTTQTSDTQSSGNVSWTHSAGGLIQTRANVLLVADVDVRLAATTSTDGTSLTFSRALSTDVSLLGSVEVPTSTIDSLVNGLLTTSVAYSWDSSATLSGLVINPNQLYKVSVDVTAGSILLASLLANAEVSVSGLSESGGDVTLDLLSVLTVDDDGYLQSGTVDLYFTSASDLDSLTFNFSADALAGLSVLGGATNMDVLTFSNLTVTAVPEPDVAGLALLSGIAGLFLFRRRSV